jgi:hypothetical protein
MSLFFCRLFFFGVKINKDWEDTGAPPPVRAGFSFEMLRPMVTTTLSKEKSSSQSS